MREKLARRRQIWFGRLMLIVFYLGDGDSREFFPPFARQPCGNFSWRPSGRCCSASVADATRRMDHMDTVTGPMQPTPSYAMWVPGL